MNKGIEFLILEKRRILGVINSLIIQSKMGGKNIGKNIEVTEDGKLQLPNGFNDYLNIETVEPSTTVTKGSFAYYVDAYNKVQKDLLNNFENLSEFELDDIFKYEDELLNKDINKAKVFLNASGFGASKENEKLFGDSNREKEIILEVSKINYLNGLLKANNNLKQNLIERTNSL